MYLHCHMIWRIVFATSLEIGRNVLAFLCLKADSYNIGKKNKNWKWRLYPIILSKSHVTFLLSFSICHLLGTHLTFLLPETTFPRWLPLLQIICIIIFHLSSISYRFDVSSLWNHFSMMATIIITNFYLHFPSVIY